VAIPTVDQHGQPAYHRYLRVQADPAWIAVIVDGSTPAKLGGFVPIMTHAADLAS